MHYPIGVVLLIKTKIFYMKEKYIDIEKVIADKSPQLVRWMPSFLMNYVKRILHEDDINRFIHKNKDKYGADFCDGVLEELEITYEVKGLENIPTSGGCILASNHPLGGVDALAVVSALQNVRTDIKFFANDILLNLDNLKDMFVGVNKVGSNLKESLIEVDKTFRSENAIYIFPAGLVSRKVKGEIMDLEWKKTFVSRARKYDKPIIPIHIDGRLTNFFYNLAKIRKFLGIKVNIEMFYLVNELYKQVGIHVPITIGEKIKPEELTRERSDKEWAAILKEKTFALKQ